MVEMSGIEPGAFRSSSVLSVKIWYLIAQKGLTESLSFIGEYVLHFIDYMYVAGICSMQAKYVLWEFA